jgi:hypothetical protein
MFLLLNYHKMILIDKKMFILGVFQSQFLEN